MGMANMSFYKMIKNLIRLCQSITLTLRVNILVTVGTSHEAPNGRYPNVGQLSLPKA